MSCIVNTLLVKQCYLASHSCKNSKVSYYVFALCIFWLQGGQGQRKLIVVATESEGYTGRLLKTVTNNGKLILYIVPLQEELDASPLPHNAPEFSKMPKSSCKNCGVVMPLQFLALHIKSCNAEIVSNTHIIQYVKEWSVVHYLSNSTSESFFVCSKPKPST